ncbi:MAG: FecR domain-containing protein [Myxococcales bacterium]
MSCSFRQKLEAFVAATLPDDERRAVLSHLPSCPACREEATRLASLRQVLGHLSPYEPQDADWQRIDRAVLAAMGAALDDQRAPASMGWVEAWLPAFSMTAAAAAVLLVTFVGLSPGPAPVAPVAAASSPRSAALAVALGDGVRVFEPSGASRLLTGGSVDEGDTLQVAEVPLTLQTAPATGVRVSAHSRIGLDHLALAHTALLLESGEIAAEVKPLAAGHTFQIRTADLLVSVRGTAFKVIREPGSTRVEVAHGLVSVEREGGDSVLVPGPGAVEIPDGAPLFADLVQRQVSPDTEADFPLGLPDRSLSELAELPARHVEPPALTAPVLAGATTAAPVAATVAPPAPAVPHVRASQAKTAALRDAFGSCLRETSRLKQLGACYDLALKADLNLSGKLTLSVSVDATGAVRSVEASRASRGFLACAQDVVRRCEQPGIGEDVTLELPIELGR